MAQYTIVLGGSQESSVGFPKGLTGFMLILSRGVPDSSVYPVSHAGYGSEYIDCDTGLCYLMKPDGSWEQNKNTAAYTPPVVFAESAAEDKPKPN